MKPQFRILDILGIAAIIIMAAGFARTLYSLWKYTDWQPVAIGVAVFAIGYILTGIKFSRNTPADSDEITGQPTNPTPEDK